MCLRGQQPALSEKAVQIPRLYTARDVKRLVGVSQRQLTYWDESGLIEPHGNRAEGSGSRRLYTLLDVVQLKIISRLLGASVSLQKIRVALAFARDLQEEPAPLRELEVMTDGQRVVIVRSDDRLVGASNGQFLLRFAVADLVDELEKGIGTRSFAPTSPEGGPR